MIGPDDFYEEFSPIDAALAIFWFGVSKVLYVTAVFTVLFAALWAIAALLPGPWFNAS